MVTNVLITSSDEITLITLQNCPADIDYIARIFENIAQDSINVDMISLAPPQGTCSSISFTISDDDLGKILEFTSSLREELTDIKPVVSSGNCKISVYDEHMRNNPGMAATVFKAISSVNTDIRIITTSEVEISLLVTKADADAALNAIKSALNV